MDILKGYEACIQNRKDEVAQAVFDQLIELKKKRQNAVHAVLAVALPALQTGTFNLYRPLDYEAWDVIAQPIRVAVDFEFVRLHLLALMYEKLSAHAADHLLIHIETGLATKLVP